MKCGLISFAGTLEVVRATHDFDALEAEDRRVSPPEQGIDEIHDVTQVDVVITVHVEKPQIAAVVYPRPITGQRPRCPPEEVTEQHDDVADVQGGVLVGIARKLKRLADVRKVPFTSWSR